MGALSEQVFNSAPFWAWLMLLMRSAGLLMTLPGLGTEQVPIKHRLHAAIMLATAMSLSSPQFTLPDSILECGLILVSEFTFGFLIGFIPNLIMSGLSIAGQLEAQAIGLGYANLIDPSLGTSVSVLSRVKVLYATMLFLLLDGHHIVIKVISDIGSGERIGMFKPDMSTVELLLNELQRSFELAAAVGAPILISAVLAQFVLGLLTRAVPQINVFIVSLPLTVGMGLFIFTFSFDALTDILIAEFSRLEETLSMLIPR